MKGKAFILYIDSTMKAHELAKLLLEGPNVTVVTLESGSTDSYGPVNTIELMEYDEIVCEVFKISPSDRQMICLEC